ncbi:MAG: hypothetical protein ACYS9X_10520 [Planctomycetota bacterium]
MTPVTPARRSVPARPKVGACGLAGGISCVVLLGLAAPAVGQGVGDAEFKERDIERGGESYTLVSYKGGRGYRRIEVSDLRGTSVGNTQLDEVPVCVEGKFDRPLKANVFRLMGSDRQFVVADGALTAGIMSGENLWIGGVAKPVPGGASCYVVVEELVMLKEDVDLFNERCARYARARNWRKLLALGRWIETNGKLVESTTMIDRKIYSTLRDRAYRQALRLREKELAPDDVETRFEVAKMYRQLLDRTGDLRAAEQLRRVMELDPGHKQAAGMLEAMGYVAHKGRWMTRTERAEVLRKEQAEREAARIAATSGGNDTAVGPNGTTPKALATTGRIRRLLEVDRKARSGADALLALAAGLPKEDDTVARRLVWILANAGGDVGLDGLLGGLQSRSAAVRKDVADALAWCGCVRDLAGMIPGEKQAEVRSHAVSALGSMRTRKSVGALVDLLAIDDVGTRARVGEELARATGQKITGADAWRRWWERNRDGFEEPGATP